MLLTIAVRVPNAETARQVAYNVSTEALHNHAKPGDREKMKALTDLHVCEKPGELPLPMTTDHLEPFDAAVSYTLTDASRCPNELLAIIAGAFDGRKIASLSKSERTTVQLLTIHNLLEVDGLAVRVKS